MANVVSPIVIINKNTVRKTKMKANPTKRPLSSSSPNLSGPRKQKEQIFGFPKPF